eukprot:PhM_4_TR14610/c0_g1_i1/m.84390/K00737/MGAT3; beta-1,4-mannosyl-glycoprotein beta-1,4-N-acetylglucosaminyltransferase
MRPRLAIQLITAVTVFVLLRSLHPLFNMEKEDPELRRKLLEEHRHTNARRSALSNRRRDDPVVLWSPNDITTDCSAFGADVRPYTRANNKTNSDSRRRLVHYAVMLGRELDMLEVVLHEVYPAVDTIVIAEANVSHSLSNKPMYFRDAILRRDPRWVRFLDKVKHVALEAKAPSSKLRKPWDVVRWQMKELETELARSIAMPGDVVVVTDIDELPSRHTLMAWRRCEWPVDERDARFALGRAPRMLQFMYTFGCLVHTDALVNTYAVSTLRAFEAVPSQWEKLRKNRFGRISVDVSDAQKRSIARLIKEGQGGWHMSSFGSVEAILKKYRHTAHRFFGQLPRVNVTRAREGCLSFDGHAMYPLPSPKSVLGDDVLPYLVAQRRARYEALGWFPENKN